MRIDVTLIAATARPQTLDNIKRCTMSVLVSLAVLACLAVDAAAADTHQFPTGNRGLKGSDGNFPVPGFDGELSSDASGSSLCTA